MVVKKDLIGVDDAIDYFINHDALTGLSNRHYFFKHLKEVLQKETTKSAAVLFFDLDRFMVINDSLGHEIGDLLLKEVAQRLINCLDQADTLARNGGDEFLVSLINLNHKEVMDTMERILTCFDEPFIVDCYEIYSSPSIGVSFYPHDGKDVDSLIKKADVAMYHVKNNGKNNFQFYRSNQTDNIHNKLEIEVNLHKAINNNEFFLQYQPKMDLFTGKMIGMEALIRWDHPEKGMVSPGEFIPLAEETGLIIPIGEWVLRTACKQIRAWQKQGLPSFIISVNLSGRQLYQPNFAQIVKSVLEETGLDAEYLELEITESTLMDIPQGLKVLNELKTLGVKISLDDFGTGYSSLNYLRIFPIDVLKIDQSFVRNSTQDSTDAAIVKTIITMAHQLEMQVIAEGVESKDHLVFLQRNHCDGAQGYLFSKPLLPEEIAQRHWEMEEILLTSGIQRELSNHQPLENVLELTRQELAENSELKKSDNRVCKTEKPSGLSQIASGVAHGIRNPLLSIKSTLQIMQKDLGKPNDIDNILAEIDNIEKIINEFLHFQR